VDKGSDDDLSVEAVHPGTEVDESGDGRHRVRDRDGNSDAPDHAERADEGDGSHDVDAVLEDVEPEGGPQVLHRLQNPDGVQKDAESRQSEGQESQ
jgi:hypothetical protein